MPVWHYERLTESAKSRDLGPVEQERTNIEGFSTRGLVIVTVVVPAIFAIIYMVAGMK